MNLNKKIGYLLDKGLTPTFVSKLNENKINFLMEKFTKKENKEATTTTKTEKVTTYTPDEITKMKQQNIGVNVSNGEVTPTPQGGLVVKQQTEGEIKEKFESKAQQGLFWARCNKCENKNCKWCKMAKEFSKSTTKKQYEKMPEKKHPEKTVKYKKNETKENFTFKDYLGKLGSVYTAEMANKIKDIRPRFSESVFEKNLEKIIENNLKPTMKKRDLIRLIEITMGDTKEKETETAPDKTKEKEKTGNPFKKPDRDPAEARRKKYKGDTTKEKETETAPDKTKEKEKTGNPFKKPDRDPAEAGRKGEQSEGLDYFMSQVKKHRLI